MSLDMNKLNEIFASSQERVKEEELRKKQKHEEFLTRLRDSVNNFIEDLREEIEGRLVCAAQRGRKIIRFESQFIFSKPYGNVKISTLVYGWRSPERKGWDIERFKEIGLEKTPFDTLRNQFQEKGIKITNISDPSKGYGFWIEASFD